MNLFGGGACVSHAEGQRARQAIHSNHGFGTRKQSAPRLARCASHCMSGADIGNFPRTPARESLRALLPLRRMHPTQDDHSASPHATLREILSLATHGFQLKWERTEVFLRWTFYVGRWARFLAEGRRGREHSIQDQSSKVQGP